ncbi:hypothetical protein HY375_03340 [Candidatus Berkelbacteria bacterium]|nr:hypothetical protein [Candidatus Berkelbacteria bacterium]
MLDGLFKHERLVIRWLLFAATLLIVASYVFRLTITNSAYDASPIRFPQTAAANPEPAE